MARIKGYYSTPLAKKGDTVLGIDFSSDSKHRQNWAHPMVDYIGEHGIVSSNPYKCNGEDWVDVTFKNGASWSYPLQPLVVIGSSYNTHLFDRETLREEESKVIRLKKKKITIMPANLPHTTGIQPKKKTGREIINKYNLLAILDHYGYDNDQDTQDDLRYAIELEYNTDSYFTVDFNASYTTFVHKINARQAMRERMEGDCPEYLGGWNLDYIKEAFQRIRGHNISDNMLDSLYSDCNYQEIGLLMQNTVGFLPEFINVIIHHHNEEEVIRDVLMRGERISKCIIDNKEYYYGGL